MIRIHPKSFCLFVCFLYFLMMGAPPAGAQSEPAVDPQQALRQSNEIFLRGMITKEAFLLGIVRSVNEELMQRRSEGLTAVELGVADFMTPEETLLDDYMDEFRRISEILEQIVELESLAKRQIHMEALQVLTSLRERVNLLLRSGTLGTLQAPDDVTETVTGVSPETESSTEDGSSAEADPALETPTTADMESVDPFILFEQWKFNRLLEYEQKLTEYKLMRSRLLQSAGDDQEARMFQRYLRSALENYQIGDYRLARLQLRDILETYPDYRHMDDVLFYASEASYGLNYLDEASQFYRQLTRRYPESLFANKALMKLIYIDYIYRDSTSLFEHYDELMASPQTLDEESMGAISYLVGYTHFKLDRYEEAETPLARVRESSSYYYPAIYLTAACYSNLGNDDLALSIYDQLALEDPRGKGEVFAQIQNNAILKLGLIHYERGDHATATAYFDLVSNNMDAYDLSIIGRAWSAYRSGKPGEALMNAEWILRNSMLSKYAYEAKILAARSKELLGHPEEAIADLKDAFRMGQRADEILPDLPKRTMLSEELEGLEDQQRRSISQRERNLLLGAQEVRRFLESSASATRPAAGERASEGGRIAETSRMLSDRIDALDEMEVLANTGVSTGLVDDIRLLRGDMIETLSDYSERLTDDLFDPGEDPFIQHMGLTEYLKYSFQHLIDRTLEEKRITHQNILAARALIAEAGEQDNLDVLIRTEIRRGELEEYYGRLNQYEIWLREHAPEEYRVELNQWAAFSGYGISDINFSRIQEMDDRIAEISETITALDHVFESKRRNLENRIRGLLTDVSKIERQMQQESENRDRRERDRFFNTEYFDRQRQEAAVGRLREEPEIEERRER